MTPPRLLSSSRFRVWSGDAEELVRVRHARRGASRAGRARSGPCARAPASRRGSTSPEAHPPPGWRTPWMSDASKSKRPPGLVHRRLLAHPSVLLDPEPVLVQDPLADAHGARRAVVVVVAGVLPVDPADEPDVDVRVAVELLVEARLGVVPDVRAPEMLRRHELGGQARHRRAIEIACPPEPARAARSRGRSRQQARRVCRTGERASQHRRTRGRQQASGASRRPACRCRTRAARRRTSRCTARSPAGRASTRRRRCSGRAPSGRRRRAARAARAGTAPPPPSIAKRTRRFGQRSRPERRARRGTPPASAPGSRPPTPTSPVAPGLAASPASGWTNTTVPAVAAASSSVRAAIEVDERRRRRSRRRRSRHARATARTREAVRRAAHQLA